MANRKLLTAGLEESFTGGGKIDISIIEKGCFKFEAAFFNLIQLTPMP
jgi:hypothetical protein